MMWMRTTTLIVHLTAGCSLELVPTHQLAWSAIARNQPTSQPAPDPEPQP